MAEIAVTIKVETPIHLGSGQADVTIDAEIIHDALGFPYFPAKRFKGLLYESAVEIFEMFELAGISTENLAPPEEIFHRESDDAGKVSSVQLIVHDFYFKDYEKLRAEWSYLQSKFKEFFEPTDILNAYTSIRYQTELENGVALDQLLHNMRVLNSGVEFSGTLTLLNGDARVLNTLALAIKNISAAGTKRNRGFGRINCNATGLPNVEKFLAKEAR
ncbi:MAG: hypothetical protein J5809_05305 [Selenomonadaceae bacterium]|nr:hypothetical protein [Selenomonadaceae bacterium]